MYSDFWSIIQNMEIFSQIIGWVGTFLIVLAYFLVSNNKVKPDSKIYQFMNLFGSIGVGFNVFYQKAWPGFILEVIWGIIALITIIKILRNKR
jgi:hypothetical protein